MNVYLKPVLERLCVRYLLKEKRRGFALDPVANFHLRNGAKVLRLNWAADKSEKGLDQSFGMMVNYQYVLDDVERCNSGYVQDGTIAIVEGSNLYEYM